MRFASVKPLLRRLRRLSFSFYGIFRKQPPRNGDEVDYTSTGQHARAELEIEAAAFSPITSTATQRLSLTSLLQLHTPKLLLVIVHARIGVSLGQFYMDFKRPSYSLTFLEYLEGPFESKVSFKKGGLD